MSGLSIILRGTIDDRLNWAFNLYDLNKDGCITKEVGWRCLGCSLGPAQVCAQQGQGQDSGPLAVLWTRGVRGQYLLSSALQTGLSWQWCVCGRKGG